MAFSLTVKRQQTNISSAAAWADIATSTDSAKHIVILGAQIFNEGSSAETMWLRFDEASASAQWKIVVGGVAGAGCNLPVLVGDVGKDIEAILESTGDIQVSVQFVEVTPYEARLLMSRGV